jgi:hypothetical protein
MLDADVVNSHLTLLRLVVIDRGWALRGNVLYERPAERDVHELDAATDREGRDPSLVCEVRQGQLTPVAAGMDGGSHRGALGAVLGGIDVLPSRQNDSRHHRRNGVELLWFQRREDEGGEAGRAYGVHVRLIQPDAHHPTDVFGAGGKGN